jgi:ssDNA-binding Zn-finger/Zn-ribbon topoisomerase 1
MIEAARKRRESAEKERSSAEAEERRRTHWQKCPKCGGDMNVEKISGIEMDKCSSCEGIFFDRGELEELLLTQEPHRRGFFRKLMGFGEG